MKKLFIILSLLFFNLAFTFADFSFQSIADQYTRFEEISGNREISLSNFNTDPLNYSYNFWNNFSYNLNISRFNSFNLDIISPEIFVSYNHDYASGGSDRAALQGKGINSSVISGFLFYNKYFSLRFSPEIFISQNSDFEIVPTAFSSGYGDYWTVFDNLQRYGDDPFYILSLGQSAIRINYSNLSLGIGTENITTGFAKRNSFLLSNNAQGFPHVDFGSEKPFTIKYLGSIEPKMLWGVLQESPYFDDNTSNDYGWISGMFVGYTPAFAKNLMIGFNHLYTSPLSEWDYRDLVGGIPGVDSINTPGDSGDNDMMVSLTYRWVFPKSGFEIYGEWARNDNYTSWLQLYSFPEHTQGYTLGLSSILAQINSQAYFQLSIEYTDSMRERTALFSPAGPWYRHGYAGWTQGYTNNGQIIGLDIGPGSESLWLELKYIFLKGSLSLIAERVVMDKDYYYEVRDGWGLSSKNDVYGVPTFFNLGLQYIYNLDKFQIYAGFMNNLNFNRNFVKSYHQNNLHFEFGITSTF
ncbi:MAG: hypothetical protein JXR64_09660 [Spirochaetales bacterium]|nr:hypothetical protein [Spirochaetales bacterium]